MVFRSLCLAILVVATPVAAKEDPRRALLNSSDYPAESIKRGEQGIVRARLRISTEGRVLACSIVQSATPLLDAATCRVLTQRAVFRPEKGPDGKAIESDYETPPIRWVLPKPEAKPPQQGLRL